MKKKHLFCWLLQIIAAFIMLQTLYFKFSGHEESVYIFSTLGIEPYGRIGSGIVELIASVLLLIPSLAWIGAGISVGTMMGAIMAHLLFIGVEVKSDGGYLFILALVVLFSSIGILIIRNADGKELLNKIIKKS